MVPARPRHDLSRPGVGCDRRIGQFNRRRRLSLPGTWHLGNVVFPNSSPRRGSTRTSKAWAVKLDTEDIAAINGLDKGVEGRISADPAVSDFAEGRIFTFAFRCKWLLMQLVVHSLGNPATISIRAFSGFVSRESAKAVRCGRRWLAGLHPSRHEVHHAVPCPGALCPQNGSQVSGQPGRTQVPRIAFQPIRTNSEPRRCLGQREINNGTASLGQQAFPAECRDRIQKPRSADPLPTRYRPTTPAKVPSERMLQVYSVSLAQVVSVWVVTYSRAFQHACREPGSAPSSGFPDPGNRHRRHPRPRGPAGQVPGSRCSA